MQWFLGIQACVLRLQKGRGALATALALLCSKGEGSPEVLATSACTRPQERAADLLTKAISSPPAWSRFYQVLLSLSRPMGQTRHLRGSGELQAPSFMLGA